MVCENPARSCSLRTDSNPIRKHMDDFVNGDTMVHNMSFLVCTLKSCLKSRTKQQVNSCCPDLCEFGTTPKRFKGVRRSLPERPHHSAADRPNHWSSRRPFKQDPFSMWKKQFLIPAVLSIIQTCRNVVIWTLAVYHRIKAIGQKRWPLKKKLETMSGSGHISEPVDSQPVDIVSLHRNLK